MPPDDRARTLRNALVDDLLRRDILGSPRVAEAMRAVPRHPFAPWLSLEEAYSDRAWIIPGMTPEAPATLSQPTAVALMLEGFDLSPGGRVLEIGAGTGYNAALMAHLVGPAGQVVTVDIEAQLAEAARERLRFYRNVEVVHGDGAYGHPALAPYDRIVATVGAWDLPPAWREQLAPEGRLVVPLHLGGEAQDHILVSLRREGPLLVGVGLCSVGMVLMRGDFAGHGRTAAFQNGPEWRGAPVPGLRVTVSPRGVSHELRPFEKVIEKASVRLVLAAPDPGEP